MHLTRLELALDRAVERFGVGYLGAYLIFELLSALLISLGGIGFVALYEPIDRSSLLRITLAVWAGVAVCFAWSAFRVVRAARPLTDWLRRRSSARTSEAWRCGAELPLTFVRAGWRPAVLALLAGTTFMAMELALSFISIAVVLTIGALALSYATILHFFAAELVLRPVLDQVGKQLDDSPPPSETLSLRWRLLIALPGINVIAGVVAAGLAGGGQGSFEQLEPAAVAAIAIASMVSLLLTGLIVQSLVLSVDRLVGAADRVGAGDLTTRVAIASSREFAELGESFNRMVGGLAEREALATALSSYVHPKVAESVVHKEAVLVPIQADATVLFVDLRGFTAFTEGATPDEALALVDKLLAMVVPVLDRHGGYASNVIGDAVLCVFGVPDAQDDHANRALKAAAQIGAGGEDAGLPVSIGVSSGTVIAGGVESGDRRDYVILGDPVNVAARIQELTRDLESNILLSGDTRSRLRDPKPTLRSRGSTSLRGRQSSVELFALDPDKS